MLLAPGSIRITGNVPWPEVPSTEKYTEYIDDCQCIRIFRQTEDISSEMITRKTHAFLKDKKQSSNESLRFVRAGKERGRFVAQ